jgi:hypothetical protein
MDLKEFSYGKALKAATELSRWDDTITPKYSIQNPPKKMTRKP